VRRHRTVVDPYIRTYVHRFIYVRMYVYVSRPVMKARAMVLAAVSDSDLRTIVKKFFLL